MYRRRRRKGINPKYWWVWAIIVVAVILIAQNTVGKLAAENAAKREAEKTETGSVSQFCEDNVILAGSNGNFTISL